jgi:hypothetical protein
MFLLSAIVAVAECENRGSGVKSQLSSMNPVLRKIKALQKSVCTMNKGYTDLRKKNAFLRRVMGCGSYRLVGVPSQQHLGRLFGMGNITHMGPQTKVL